jgi:hypothetical protein
MIGWANLTNATAAERAKRVLAGGSGAEPQFRVRVSFSARVRYSIWLDLC